MGTVAVVVEQDRKHLNLKDYLQVVVVMMKYAEESP